MNERGLTRMLRNADERGLTRMLRNADERGLTRMLRSADFRGSFCHDLVGCFERIRICMEDLQKIHSVHPRWPQAIRVNLRSPMTIN